MTLGGMGTGNIRSGNAAAAALTGNTTSGDGSNSFAIRAVTLSGKENSVAVSGYNHMPIFVNSSSASVPFNLIRVLPGAAGQKISFSYFDAGDAQSGGSVQVLPPTDATGSVLTTPFPGSCYAAGGSAGAGTTLTNCTAPFVQDTSSPLSPQPSKNNGKTETITIPIPADYSCDFDSLGGCWYRVHVAVRQRVGARRHHLGRGRHRRPRPAGPVAVTGPAGPLVPPGVTGRGWRRWVGPGSSLPPS